MSMNEDYLHHAKVDIEEWTSRAEHLLSLANGQRRQHLHCSKYQRSLKKFLFLEKAEYFIQAAESFRICGRFFDAGAAYSRAASIYEHQLAWNEQAAILYTEAGLCLEKIEASQGSDDFRKAASLYCEIEQYSQVGRIRLWMAENDKNAGDIVNSAENYLVASKFFMADNKRTPAIASMRYAAELLYQQRNYDQASTVFADIGKYELLNNLTKFQAKESFFLSGLLLLAGGTRDFSGLKEVLGSFAECDSLFRDSPQYDFLCNMMTVIDSGNLSDFAFHVYAYNTAFDVDLLTLEIMEDVKKFFIIE